MKPALLTLPAQADLEDARLWYENRECGLGSRFLHAIESARQLIERSPLIFAAGFCGVRKAKHHKFPHIVLYRILKTHIEVFAIVHGRRSASAWTNRLPKP